MSTMQRFTHTLHNRDISLAALMVDGTPWFRALNVATALGYTNTQQAVLNNVDEQDRKQLKDLIINEGDSEQHKGEEVFISELGMHSLILSSQTPQAKAMRRWVMTICFAKYPQHSAMCIAPRGHTEACGIGDC